MFCSTISQKKKKKIQDTRLLYLWFSLWWCPVDIWEKKRTSSSFLPSTGCLSSGNQSEGKRRRAAWERGAPFRTLPLLTCSFSDRWQGKKNRLCPLPEALTISETLQSLPVLLFPCSPPSLENFQSFQVSPLQATPENRCCCFFIKPTLVPVSSPNLIRNSLPLVPNSHKLTG